jgi:uncharacterized protein (TIGR00725 family)
VKILEKFLKVFRPRGYQETLVKPVHIQQIAVFGYSDAKAGSKLYQEAFDVCKVLASAGYIIVDGGGPGVMEAASLGAKAGHGRVIGVTLYLEDSDNFEGRDENNLIDEEIKTTTYVERTLELMKQGQAYVIFNGGTGTISELGMAWGLARIYFGHHKPLILYGNFWKKIIKVLTENLLLRPEEKQVYRIVDSPAEVLKAIKEIEFEIESERIKDLKVSGEKGYCLGES